MGTEVRMGLTTAAVAGAKGRARLRLEQRAVPQAMGWGVPEGATAVWAASVSGSKETWEG